MLNGFVCRMCDKFHICSEARKFIITHGLKIESFVSFQMIGLRELHGDSLVDKAFALLDRFRRFKGYKYRFNADGTSVYLRVQDVGEKASAFEFNEESNFFELDAGQGKVLSATV